MNLTAIEFLEMIIWIDRKSYFHFVRSKDSLVLALLIVQICIYWDCTVTKIGDLGIDLRFGTSFIMNKIQNSISLWNTHSHGEKSGNIYTESPRVLLVQKMVAEGMAIH